MIAAPVLNRAHDGSRGSRTSNAQSAIDTETNTAHTTHSPVADGKWGGGSAEPAPPVSRYSEAAGVFVHPPSIENALPTKPNDAQQPLDRALGPSRGPPPAQPDVLPSYEPITAQQIPTIPEGKNISRFLDAFLDGSFSIPSICDEFELTVFEVLALLESTEVQSTLEALKKIATIRHDTIAPQARVTAIHRLSELATYAHTADAAQARAFETARKSAAQIIRTTDPNRHTPKPTRNANRTRHAQQKQRTDQPTTQSATAGRSSELCACTQGSSICGAVDSEVRRTEEDSSESYPTEEVGTESRRTKEDSSESYPTLEPALALGPLGVPYCLLPDP